MVYTGFIDVLDRGAGSKGVHRGFFHRLGAVSQRVIWCINKVVVFTRKQEFIFLHRMLLEHLQAVRP